MPADPGKAKERTPWAAAQGPAFAAQSPASPWPSGAQASCGPSTCGRPCDHRRRHRAKYPFACRNNGKTRMPLECAPRKPLKPTPENDADDQRSNTCPGAEVQALGTRGAQARESAASSHSSSLSPDSPILPLKSHPEKMRRAIPRQSRRRCSKTGMRRLNAVRTSKSSSATARPSPRGPHSANTLPQGSMMRAWP